MKCRKTGKKQKLKSSNNNDHLTDATLTNTSWIKRNYDWQDIRAIIQHRQTVYYFPMGKGDSMLWRGL